MESKTLIFQDDTIHEFMIVESNEPDYTFRYFYSINPHLNFILLINKAVTEEIEREYKDNNTYGMWYILGEGDIENIKKKYSASMYNKPTFE